MSGVQGATLDSIGQVYFASALGIQMCEANGRVAAILNSPEPGPYRRARVRREGYELALCGRRRQTLSPRRESEWSGGVGSGEVAAPAALSQATRASRLPGPISPADETGARRSGRASSDCCRPPSGSFQSFNDHSVGNLLRPIECRSLPRCQSHVCLPLPTCQPEAGAPPEANPLPASPPRTAACLPVRISQTRNLLRLDFDVTASHGSNPGRGGRFGDYVCGGTTRPCLRSTFSRWR